jgi:pyruvate kinase
MAEQQSGSAGERTTSGVAAAYGTREALRRAKIVATLGPASGNEATFRALVRAGLDVARLNFSHGDHADKQRLIEMVRKVSEEESKPICILADLQGPKIRTGKLVDRKPVLLETGQKLVITPEPILGTKDRIATTFVTLAENLERAFCCRTG